MLGSLADKVRGYGDIAAGKAKKMGTNTDARVYANPLPNDARSVYRP